MSCTCICLNTFEAIKQNQNLKHLKLTLVRVDDSEFVGMRVNCHRRKNDVSIRGDGASENCVEAVAKLSMF